MAEFVGHLSLRAAPRADGRTVLAAQSFRAPFHLGKTYWDADARTLIAQVVNPTAGILAGDRLASDIAVEPGAALLVTTPSASRVFRMRGGAAACEQHFSVAAGAWLEVLPEPLVPHRGCTYRQRTQVEIDPGGGLFLVDQLMPGRVAHGEAWGWDRLTLSLEVRLGGELILRERFDHTGPALRDLAALAGSGPAACFANAILVAPPTGDTPAWRTALAALHDHCLWLGVSELRQGGHSLKIVAPDAVRLRRAVRDARRILASYFPRLGCEVRKL
ncbi:MAG: urease accessory protein UreD [Opitutaceae bacterium]|nr:urease accessory protein UreD [Opitutaceae bacterium]